MFGHDDKNKQDDNAVTPAQDAALNDIAADEQAASPADDSQAGAPSMDDVSPPAISDDSPTAANSDDLLDIKKQALQQLQPLVGHLEQSPEEKFKTTMMMIQAADDQTLVQTAYEAAQHITDEKARAQALLDVINEINYFTHPQDKEAA